MLPKVFVVCLLELIAARSVLGWNHVSRAKFENIVNEEPLALVAFVAPWTEPSKALEAEWLAATARTKTALLSIDCTAEPDLCREQGVFSYPAIRVFDGSKKLRRYKGSRKASAIVSFLNRATLPTISTLDSKNITDFKSLDEVVVIAYIPEEQTALESAFTELASRNHDKFTFGIVTDKLLAQAENVQLPSVVVHKPREGEQEVLSGPSGIEALGKFLETASAPLIGEFTRRNELKYMKAGKSLVYYFAHKPQDLDNYREALKPLAKKFKEYLNFVTVDAVEYRHMLPALGLKDSGFPALAVFNPMYGQAFPHDQKEITPKVVESFVMDIVQGKVPPLGAGGGGENTKHTEL
ncbi:thioredoxin-like protein [Hyaloscypha hepaticicola]|uniref:Protein disulfide-isomerase n=1 Tax=Hyaloscypha hepaticicola TaxID=2082293 RepID=A0A2J6QGN9_9HELO|nr:thioredoxin-like protein [Hyaloscypha hepaticicola]